MEHSKEMNFTASLQLAASLKDAVRHYMSGGGRPVVLADYYVPYDSFLAETQKETFAEELLSLIKSGDATLEAASRTIALYDDGNAEKAANSLEIFSLKADNLVLQLQLMQTKLERHTSAEKQEHSFTTFSHDDLTRGAEAINNRYSDGQNDARHKELHSYLKQAPIGICILKGPDLIAEVANPLYLQLVDKTSAEFLDKPLIESLPELKGQAIERILNDVYHTGKPYVGDELGVYLDRNGSREMAYFNFVYQPLFDDNNEVSGIIVVCTEVTGMVQAKNELTTRKKEFRNIVMQSPIAITILKGSELIIEIANEVMLKDLWRKDFSEVIGRSILDVFPELNEQDYPDLLRKVMETGEPHRALESPAYVDSHDGRKLYYLDYEYAPMYELDGSISGIMCTVNDVTPRVEARRLEKASQQRLAKLIETLPIAMYTIDANGYIDLYNHAAEVLWGRKPQPGIDRWCGSYRLSALDGTPIAHDYCPMARAFNEGRSIQEEIYMYRTNGERRHVIVHPQALFDEDGNTIGASKVMLDITESKEASNALQKSEEKFRLLSASIPQFIWTLDSEGNLDYFNDAMSRYTGYTEEEIRSGAFMQMIHPEDRECNEQKWKHCFATGDEFLMEQRLKNKEGEYRWHLCRALAQKDENGEILQWVGTSTDIQDQKTFQQRLESLVEERTNELKRANHELETMNKELSSFAYISSHDLQEPLRKIHTFGSIIMTNEYDNLSESGKRNFSRMQLAATRMTKLIQDLLTYSRSNTAEQTFEDTDLNTILHEVAADFADSINDKNGVISIGEMPTIIAVPFQIRQLFNNLVSNALKFTKDNIPPEIVIVSETVPGASISNPNVEPDKDYIHVSVTDNGIGFSPQYASRIFEVFQRLHGKSEYEGTGIGLAICMKIAENHKAILNASSQPGEGATFNIYFPVN